MAATKEPKATFTHDSSYDCHRDVCDLLRAPRTCVLQHIASESQTRNGRVPDNYIRHVDNRNSYGVKLNYGILGTLRSTTTNGVVQLTK